MAYRKRERPCAGHEALRFFADPLHADLADFFADFFAGAPATAGVRVLLSMLFFNNDIKSTTLVGRSSVADSPPASIERLRA